MHRGTPKKKATHTRLTDAKPSVDPGAHLPISCCVSLLFFVSLEAP